MSQSLFYKLFGLGKIPADALPVIEREGLILKEEGFVQAIVFTRTKHRARRLAQQLDAVGHRAVALQGNMSQNARDRAMRGFRSRDFDVLVATDIAARGIDVVPAASGPTPVEGSP